MGNALRSGPHAGRQ